MATMADLEYAISVNTAGLNQALPALQALTNSITALDTAVQAMAGGFATAMQRTATAAQSVGGAAASGVNQAGAAYDRLQALALNAEKAVLNLNEAVSRSGGDPQIINNNNAALVTYAQSLLSGANNAGALALAKARLNVVLGEGQRQLQQETQVMAANAAAMKQSEAAALAQENAIAKAKISVDALTTSLGRNKDSPESASAIRTINAEYANFEKTLTGGNISRTNLSRAQNSLNAALAEGKKVLNGSEVESLNAKFTELTKTIQIMLGPLSGVASRVSAFGMLFEHIGVAGAVAAVGVVGLSTAMFEAVTAGSRMEESLLRIDAALAATGNSAGLTTDQVDKMAQHVAETTTATIDQTREAAANLLTASNLTPQIFQNALLAAQGLSLIGRGDMVSQTRRLLAVLDDTSGSLKSLTEAGIHFNPVEEEQVKLFELAGQHGEAMGIVFAKLGPLMAAAQKEATGLSGSWKNFIEGGQQALAQVAVQSGVLETIAGTLNSIREAFSRVGEQWGTATVAANLFGAAVRIVSGAILAIVNPTFLAIAAIGGLILVWGKFVTSLSAFAISGTIGFAPVIVAITALALLLNYLNTSYSDTEKAAQAYAQAQTDVDSTLQQANQGIPGSLDLLEAQKKAYLETSEAALLKARSDAEAAKGLQGGAFNNVRDAFNSLVGLNTSQDIIDFTSKVQTDLGTKITETINQINEKEASSPVKLRLKSMIEPEGGETTGNRSLFMQKSLFTPEQVTNAENEFKKISDKFAPFINQSLEAEASVDGLQRKILSLGKDGLSALQEAMGATDQEFNNMIDNMKLLGTASDVLVNKHREQAAAAQVSVQISGALGSARATLIDKESVIAALMQLSAVQTRAHAEALLNDSKVLDGYDEATQKAIRALIGFSDAEQQAKRSAELTGEAVRKQAEASLKLGEVRMVASGTSDLDRTIALQKEQIDLQLKSRGIEPKDLVGADLEAYKQIVAASQEIVQFDFAKQHEEALIKLNQEAQVLQLEHGLMAIGNADRVEAVSHLQDILELTQKYGRENQDIIDQEAAARAQQRALAETVSHDRDIRTLQEELVVQQETVATMFESEGAAKRQLELQKAIYDISQKYQDGLANPMAQQELGLEKIKIQNEAIIEQLDVLKTGYDDLWKGAEDAFSEFVTKGRVNWVSLYDQIVGDIARMAFKQAIENPIKNAFGSLFGGALTSSVSAPSLATLGSKTNPMYVIVDNSGIFGTAGAETPATVASHLIPQTSGVPNNIGLPGGPPLRTTLVTFAGGTYPNVNAPSVQLDQLGSGAVSSFADIWEKSISSQQQVAKLASVNPTVAAAAAPSSSELSGAAAYAALTNTPVENLTAIGGVSNPATKAGSLNQTADLLTGKGSIGNPIYVQQNPVTAATATATELGSVVNPMHVVVDNDIFKSLTNAAANATSAVVGQNGLGQAGTGSELPGLLSPGAGSVGDQGAIGPTGVTGASGATDPSSGLGNITGLVGAIGALGVIGLIASRPSENPGFVTPGDFGGPGKKSGNLDSSSAHRLWIPIVIGLAGLALVFALLLKRHQQATQAATAATKPPAQPELPPTPETPAVPALVEPELPKEVEAPSIEVPPPPKFVPPASLTPSVLPIVPPAIAKPPEPIVVPDVFKSPPNPIPISNYNPPVIGPPKPVTVIDNNLLPKAPTPGAMNKIPFLPDSAGQSINIPYTPPAPKIINPGNPLRLDRFGNPTAPLPGDDQSSLLPGVSQFSSARTAVSLPERAFFPNTEAGAFLPNTEAVGSTGNEAAALLRSIGKSPTDQYPYTANVSAMRNASQGYEDLYSSPDNQYGQLSDTAIHLRAMSNSGKMLTDSPAWLNHRLSNNVEDLRPPETDMQVFMRLHPLTGPSSSIFNDGGQRLPAFATPPSIQSFNFPPTSNYNPPDIGPPGPVTVLDNNLLLKAPTPGAMNKVPSAAFGQSINATSAELSGNDWSNFISTETPGALKVDIVGISSTKVPTTIEPNTPPLIKNPDIAPYSFKSVGPGSGAVFTPTDPFANVRSTDYRDAGFADKFHTPGNIGSPSPFNMPGGFSGYPDLVQPGSFKADFLPVASPAVVSPPAIPHIPDVIATGTMGNMSPADMNTAFSHPSFSFDGGRSDFGPLATPDFSQVNTAFDAITSSASGAGGAFMAAGSGAAGAAPALGAAADSASGLADSVGGASGVLDQWVGGLNDSVDALQSYSSSLGDWGSKISQMGAAPALPAAVPSAPANVTINNTSTGGMSGLGGGGGLGSLFSGGGGGGGGGGGDMFSGFGSLIGMIFPLILMGIMAGQQRTDPGVATVKDFLSKEPNSSKVSGTDIWNKAVTARIDRNPPNGPQYDPTKPESATFLQDFLDQEDKASRYGQGTLFGYDFLKSNPGSKIRFHDGAIPKDMVAILTRDETVLPADKANVLMEAVKGNLAPMEVISFLKAGDIVLPANVMHSAISKITDVAMPKLNDVVPPRFHSGYYSDDLATVLAGSPQASASSRGGDFAASSEGSTVHHHNPVNVTIVANDPAAFRYSQSQIELAMSSAVDRANRRK